MGDLLVGPVVGEGVGRGLEAHHDRRRLARHLGHQPGAAPVGSHTAVDPFAPELGGEVGLEHLVGDGDPGPQRDLRHPGELVVQVAHVAGEREDPVAGLAERLADGDELLGRGGGAGGQLAVLGPVQDGTGGGGPDGAGLHRLAHQRGHLGDLLGPSHVVGPSLSEHVRPERSVRDQGGDVEHAVRPLDLVEILAEALPVPGDALGQRGARDVLDTLHQLNQPVAVARAGRREPDAAVARDHRRHAVPARGRHLGIPGDLAVVVGVDVDPARGHKQALRVDLAPGRAVDHPDFGDDGAVDGDVAVAERAARAVGDGAAPDDQVVHRCSSPTPGPAHAGPTEPTQLGSIRPSCATSR